MKYYVSKLKTGKIYYLNYNFNNVEMLEWRNDMVSPVLFNTKKQAENFIKNLGDVSINKYSMKYNDNLDKIINTYDVYNEYLFFNEYYNELLEGEEL